MRRKDTTATDSLKLKTFRGSISLGTSTLGLRVFSIFTSIILARLLTPSAFGQVALAQVVLSIVGLFSTLGLPTAVIQTPLDRNRAAFSALAIRNDGSPGRRASMRVSIAQPVTRRAVSIT